MAAEVQHGTAVLYGITNLTTAITILGYATFLPQSVNATQNFEEKVTKDANGADANWTTQNEHSIVKIKFVMSGATRAAAAAIGAFVSPLAKVTLANFLVSTLNGDYQNMSGATIDLGNEKNGEVDLTLRKYADSTQNTLATGTVITG